MTDTACVMPDDAPSDRGGPDPFEEAAAAQDAILARLGLAIWVGAEPTFTDRLSWAPEWSTEPVGGDKEARAQALASRLAGPDDMVLRTVGRQYPDEPRPRWNLGLYRRRDGGPLWRGPHDPLLGGQPCSEGGPAALRDALSQRLRHAGWWTAPLEVETPPQLRLLCRWADPPRVTDFRNDSRVARPPPETVAVPAVGLRDELAEEGLFLVGFERGPAGMACVQLPLFGDPSEMLSFLEVLGGAARDADVPGLVLAGFSPPVDAGVAWTTLTPDPAVVEVNMAPSASLRDFLARSRAAFRAAESAGLSPYRLYYNGFVGDSGGGGQVTLGGPSPLESPFIRTVGLLPGLVRYLNRHPSLSYLFAPDFVGPASQSARPDERGLDYLDELQLALDLLDREPEPNAELLWRTLGPFLADACGNTHRAEINIEKLWNPYLPGRGMLGLVEFRAFRMSQTPERLTAIAGLLRAIAAMLVRRPAQGPLRRWGRELHERFALPHFLIEDLREVCAELRAEGVGLASVLEAELREDSRRILGEARLGAVEIRLKHAVDFWPLVGDAASQEHRGSRLMDSSTARVEVALTAEHPSELERWQLAAHGWRVPLRAAGDGLRILGLRYRAFAPALGLHPMLPAHGPLQLMLSHADEPQPLAITLHEWRPNGGPYDGVPRDLADARDRRAERCVVQRVSAVSAPSVREPPAAAVTPWCLDLRRLPR